jgi:16S rRNA (cytosine967-C5)-methyltransferase
MQSFWSIYFPIMQISMSPINSDGAIYEDSRLVRLWRNWLSAAGKMPLDKWLRQNLRELAGNKSQKTKNRPASFPATQLSIVDQANLTEAMNNALRFQQLACALEFAFRNNVLDNNPIDWLEWDHHWQPEELQSLSISAFWYWIQLRVVGRRAKQNPTQLPDAQAREVFFARLLGSNYFAQTEAAYLWNGLRPQWQPLISQRKNASSWSDLQVAQFLRLQTITPPLWLRLQSCETVKRETIKDIHEQLLSQSVHAEIDIEHGIYVHGGRGINTTREYQSGDIEIQDLASQLIARSVDVTSGQKIWDACAGAGGKTLAIATRMNNKGALVATDLHEYKLEELKRRVKRAGIFNVRAFSWNGEEPLRLPKEIAQQQGFDWVLVDAPCSSSGTWRRNPDARWRFDEVDTQELIQLQRKILRNAATAVREGGSLVYATCSWQVSENEAQVNWFIQDQSQFSVQYQRILGAPELNSDTMFVAVLKRG